MWKRSPAEEIPQLWVFSKSFITTVEMYSLYRLEDNFVPSEGMKNIQLVDMDQLNPAK